MTYKDAIDALTADALKMVRPNQTLGLGSGRAATALVAALGNMVCDTGIVIRGAPTSMQIRIKAEAYGMSLVDPGEISHVDIVFDGADQIDSDGYMVKGGGGALLRERILIGMADQTIIMADQTKFVQSITMPVPVEVHPAARRAAADQIERLGARTSVRMSERGYPAFTENGNIILDSQFDTIKEPPALASTLRQIPGVLEAGIFDKPDIIYKAQEDGQFTIIRPRQISEIASQIYHSQA